MLQWSSMDMKRLFPGWMSSDARNYIHPGQSTNVACLPLLPRTTLPKTRIEADGTVSLCSSSSLMRSRYERVRGEREREREREKACISKQRPAIGKAPVGRLPVWRGGGQNRLVFDASKQATPATHLFFQGCAGVTMERLGLAVSKT